MYPRRILIAHQSTIPHYRVGFYQAVQRRRPDSWTFEVVYDQAESERRQYLALDPKQLDFATLPTHGLEIGLGSSRLLLQTFPLKARRYDLVLVGDEMKNLSYPLAHSWQLVGKRVARWGHGRDAAALQTRGLKRLSEGLKLQLSRRASGFFAYTDGIRDWLVEQGLKPEQVFSLNNTIDIHAQRRLFEKEEPARERHRSDAGVSNGKLLLFVGRLTKARRLDFLADTLNVLRKLDPCYRLIIVGVGERERLKRFSELGLDDIVEWRGGLPDAELAKLLVAADLYIYPGPVGLGPLQALCFDLPPILIDSDLHKPEYDYLSSNNAVICPRGTTAQDYAAAVHATLAEPQILAQLRRQAWPSIEHLTIDNMADRFINGVETLLAPRVGASPGHRARTS